MKTATAIAALVLTVPLALGTSAAFAETAEPLDTAEFSATVVTEDTAPTQPSAGDEADSTGEASPDAESDAPTDDSINPSKDASQESETDPAPDSTDASVDPTVQPPIEPIVDPIIDPADLVEPIPMIVGPDGEYSTAETDAEEDVFHATGHIPDEWRKPYFRGLILPAPEDSQTDPGLPVLPD